jgi:aspartate/methionine/tyrosine aminotransferase
MEISKVFIAHNERRKSENKPPLFVIADEVARNVILDPAQEFVHIGSLPGMEDFTLTAWSLSKDQAPGLGVSIGIGPKWLIERVRNDDTGPAFAMQCGAAAMFREVYEERMIKHYQESNIIYVENLHLVKLAIKSLNSALCDKLPDGQKANFFGYEESGPDGGFQFVFDAKGLLGAKFPDGYKHIPNSSQTHITSSLDLAWYLRETARVEFIPGEGFGFDGEEMMFRMTLGKRQEQLGLAFRRVGEELLKLSISPPAIVEKFTSEAVSGNLQAQLQAKL